MSAIALIGGLVGLVVAFLFIRIAEVERRVARMSRLDAKVDALMKHAGIHFDPFQDVPGDVRDALARGETIDAIRRLRQATGVGLKEAKDVIDDLRRQRGSTA